MSTGIFHIDQNGNLSEMNQQEYSSEDFLQKLLEDYPSLIPGNQVDELNPRKWIFISREFSIPDSESSSGRWSLDHLLLDQDGIPTFIETKRGSDTRIRREVVGQMLDYAANATAYWAIERIQAQFELNCKNKNIEPETALRNKFEDEINYDDYWKIVSDNLQSGRIRMIFVSDEIPFELRQIVEFLNEQMNPAEVLAVEIRQYVGKNNKTLVPRVIGQTSKLQRKKSTVRDIKRWNEDSFLTELKKNNGIDDVRIAKDLLEWCKSKNIRIWWGKGKRYGSCFPVLDHNGEAYTFFAMWTYGGIEIQFQYMKNKPVFDDIENRKIILRKLNMINGISIPEHKIELRPSIPYSVLRTKNNLESFKKIWDNFINEIKAKT